LGDKDNAIYHYEKATQLNSKYDEAYYNLAVMLYLQESYFNALMNIEKAVNIQSQNVTYTELKAAIKERISNSRA
jgi:Flp pilus assembly protein TadD